MSGSVALLLIIYPADLRGFGFERLFGTGLKSSAFLPFNRRSCTHVCVFQFNLALFSIRLLEISLSIFTREFPTKSQPEEISSLPWIRVYFLCFVVDCFFWNAAKLRRLLSVYYFIKKKSQAVAQSPPSFLFPTTRCTHAYTTRIKLPSLDALSIFFRYLRQLGPLSVCVPRRAY